MAQTQTLSTQRPRKSSTFFPRNNPVIADPAFAMFALFALHRIIQTIALSFFEWRGIGPGKRVGFDKCRQLHVDPVLRALLVNNITWLVRFLLGPVPGVFVALFLNQNVFGIRLVKSLFFFSFVLSPIVVGLWPQTAGCMILRSRSVARRSRGTTSPLSAVSRQDR